MNKKTTIPPQTLRPTKKQQGILDFIVTFTGEHGYSPSYREIMNALQYSSIATIALHVDSLIARGHLQKRDNAARSLEVVGNGVTKASGVLQKTQESWLVSHITSRFEQVEAETALITQTALEELYVLVGALKVLGCEDAARGLIPRLMVLKEKITS